MADNKTDIEILISKNNDEKFDTWLPLSKTSNSFIVFILFFNCFSHTGCWQYSDKRREKNSDN